MTVDGDKPSVTEETRGIGSRVVECVCVRARACVRAYHEVAARITAV